MVDLDLQILRKAENLVKLVLCVNLNWGDSNNGCIYKYIYIYIYIFMFIYFCVVEFMSYAQIGSENGPTKL